jgi:hypothetical protein
MEVILLRMMHQQMMSPALTHLQTTEKITRSHPIGSEGFRSDSGRVFQNVEFVCKKYHICILSTNVNQYLAFRPPQWTWWVYELGAQVRKHKYRKSLHWKKPSSRKDPSTVPSNITTFKKDIIQKTRDTFPLRNFKDPQDRKTLMDCSSLMNAIKQRPQPLPEVSRRV